MEAFMARLALHLFTSSDTAPFGNMVGGIINLGVGIGLIIVLRALLGSGPGSPFLCGLIPGFIGVGMLVYAFFLASSSGVNAYESSSAARASLSQLFEQIFFGSIPGRGTSDRRNA
jgi:hypothetical protein